MCFVLIFLVISLTACRNPSLPLGIWQSEDQNMTLFIDGELIIRGDGEWGGTFPGIYMQDGEEVDIIIQVDWKDSGFVIEFDRANPIFQGYHWIENGRLYIREHSFGREPNEIKTIIFELVEEVSSKNHPH